LPLKSAGAAAGIRTRVVGFLRFRWMEGHWTLGYVLDQAVRIFLSNLDGPML